jgi:mercuric ion transport protein
MAATKPVPDVPNEGKGTHDVAPDFGTKKILAAAGGLLAALAASSCCVIPLVLFTLGIGGAWISNLTALAPYQPVFVVMTLGFVAGGFVAVYRKPQAACVKSAYCATPASDRIAKIGLWTATLLIAIALGFPYLAPLFIDT